MGTWDVGSFQNDTAGDWSFGMAKNEDLSLVKSTLQTVVDAGAEDLESPDGEEAIAAAEVIARLKGHWGHTDSYSERVDTWVRSHPQIPPQKLVDLALQALDCILAEPSELVELWEGPNEQDWRESVEDLRLRVAAEPQAMTSASEVDLAGSGSRKWWEFWK